MKKNRLLYTFIALAGGILTATGQTRLAQDSVLEQQLLATGLIHRPLPLDTARSYEADAHRKNVLRSVPLLQKAGTEGWSHEEEGTLTYDSRHTVSSQGSIKLQYATYTGRRATGPADDPDYATYGHCRATYSLGEGRNLEAYNRLTFSIYPDCDGARVVNMDLTFTNADTPAKAGYNRPSGSHHIPLQNKQWNHCTLEIGEYQRDKVLSIAFSTTLRGRDETTGDSATYYIDNLMLQEVEAPDPVSGWQPAPGRIIYSTTGYFSEGEKTAILSTTDGRDNEGFRLLDAHTGRTVYQGTLRTETTTIGTYRILDFTPFHTPGEYCLKTDEGSLSTPPFRIGQRIWEDSQWRVLNFIFCQRCGYAVPGVHGACHADLVSKHDGRTVAYCGGWHDAGDLSQQTLQTADVMYALFEAGNACRTTNPALSARLREEAEWGLEFVLKNRLGRGWHASSMGLLIWTDGIEGTMDDISSVRTQCFAFDNFLYAAYEAYAALSLTDDTAMQEHLRRVAEEDFSYALDKWIRDGYDRFVQPYEHTYGTSRSQYRATMSWAASLLYRLTGKAEYARLAAEHIDYVLQCQRTEPVGEADGRQLSGFFYRDTERRSIVHNIHQSREQVYAQALVELLRTQPKHPDHARWLSALRLYGGYLKALMPYTAPYGMLPSGVYHSEEHRDMANFYALHLFPPTNAKELYTEQLRQGERLDSMHYVKRFPVWFNIFNGNTAVHLALGKAAALTGRYLGDEALLQIGREQLYWTVGKNPFGQSLIYGEGRRYPQLNNFSSGQTTGAIPVGIRTLGNADVPYWPQTNNACYKEVWVTSAGKWLSLIAEY